jgi:hypothetical protein
MRLRTCCGGSQENQQWDLTNSEAIIDTVLVFIQSLDDRSKFLMHSVTTEDIIFDGILFSDIGLGASKPLVG